MIKDDLDILDRRRFCIGIRGEVLVIWVIGVVTFQGEYKGRIGVEMRGVVREMGFSLSDSNFSLWGHEGLRISPKV
jgi:hypothetical protein